MPFQCKFIFYKSKCNKLQIYIVMIQLSAMCFTVLLVYWSTLYSGLIKNLKININKKYFIFLKETLV